MAIRDEGPSDGAAIRAVIEAAFGRSDEADLVDRLRHDRDFEVSLLAEDNEAVVGYALFSPMRAPFRALGLAPVAVAPERQRAGIGSGLVDAGLARARAAGWQGVFVLGDPDYYRRFGFDPALASGFASVYAGPHLMVLPLGPGLPTRRGQIDYAPAFTHARR